MIILPFPTNTHQLLCNSLSMVIAQLNNQLLTKVVESIIQQLNKKGFIPKQLALPLLINIVTMPQDIPTLSYQLSQDIGTTILKLLKNTECRLSLTKTFRFISQYFAQDVLKYSIKFTQNEKSKGLREAGLQSLIYLMKKNENLTSYGETIINLVFRQEDNNLQYKLISAFLPHQDSLQTFIGKKNDKSKIQKTVNLTQKEEITKIFQIFNNNLSKFPSNMISNIILCYRKYLSLQLEKYGLVICRGGFEIATSCLGRLSSDDIYLHQIYKAGCQLGIYLIHLLQEKDKEEMIEYFFEKIKKNNYKNQVHILKLLLKGLNTVLDGLSNYDSLYIEKLQVVFSIQEVTLKTITIQSPIRASVNRNIYSILQTLFLENKKWQQNILSALLNHAKISIAELSVNQTSQLQQTLSTQCICLASLFKLLDVNLHSVPQELINQLWEISKQFITQKQSPLLIKTGWIIMAELMMVPYFASQNKLKEILVLIQQVLKEMPTEIQEDQLNQFRAIGLVSISLINGQQFKSLSDSMRKFLAQQLILFFQALTNSNSKLDRNLPVLMSAKYILFQALRLLNPKHYASHLNALVQFSVEEALLSTTVYQDVNFWKPNHYFDEQVGDVRSELQLAIATMKFLGYIMATNSFTIKNKVNFIKYLHGNLVQVKDKPQKLQVYLFALHHIVIKIQHLQVSDEFNEHIFAMVDLCWNSDCQVIQKLCAQVYCLLLKDHNKEDQLNKLLSSKQPPHGTLIYLIIEILERKITQIELQIQNLFMKVVSHLSMNQEDFIKLAFQLFQRVDSSLLKNSFVFIVFSMMKDNNQIKLPNNVLHNYLKTGGQPNNYYQMLLFECRCASQFKPFEMLKLQSNNDQVYTLIEKYISSMNLPKLFEVLQYFQKDIKLDIHRLILYLNNLFKIQKVQSSQIEIDLRSKMKSLIVQSFNMELDQLLILIQPYILGEFIADDKQNKIHIRTRIFLLKRLQKLFSQFTNITLVFDFLFKIVTSNYDETKELSFKMFEYFFKSISKQPEQVINFAAQIDSIVSDTIRRESQNSPNVNLVNMKILSKFVKIINSQDKNLSIKLLNLLIKPIYKKMIPSQFYSEKSQSNLFIQRLKSLASIYLDDPSIFEFEQVEQMKQCVEQLLQDFFVILCTPRSYLRGHQNFTYFYSGKKHYYDSQSILQSLPKLLKISALNSKLHCCLIGFVITQSSPLEHLQNYYVKLMSSMTVETINQMKKYKIKGINLLFQILGKSQNIVMQGIEDLMPLIIEMAPLNTKLISKLYHQLSVIFIEKTILQPYIQAIIISTQEIYTICDNSEIKQECLSTLFNFLKSGEESERIIQTHWDYLMNSNYTFSECKEYVNRIGVIQNLNLQLSTISTNILEILEKRSLRQEDYYLILQLAGIIRDEEQLILLNELISKQFLEFLKQAAKIFAQQKCVDSLILQILIPIIQGRIQQNQNESIEIIQFFLLVFVLHDQKDRVFLQMVKVILLFVDPNLNPQIVQTAENALKHMISITQCSSEGFPPKLKMIVDALRAQNNKEMEEKQLKAQKIKQTTQQGTIKLKMFGQK